MKKVFSVLVIAALAISAVWAQDEEEGVVKVGSGEVKIIGGVKGGLRVDGSSGKHGYTNLKNEAKDDGKYATDIYGYSDDIDDGTALRGEIGAIYTNGPVGLKVNVRENVGLDPTDPFKTTLSHAYGWVNLFGERPIVVISGGIIGDDVWGTAALGGTGTDTSYDDRNVRLAIQPIAGLTFGASWVFGRGTDPLKNGYDRYPANAYYRGNSAAEFFGSTVIGALYNNENILGVSVSLRLNPGLVYLNPADSTEEKTATRGADLLFGFKLNALPKLTLIVDGQFTGLGIDKDSFTVLNASVQGPNPADYILPTNELYAKVAYRITDPFNLGVRFHLNGCGSVGDSDLDKNIVKTDFDIRLFADYEVTPNIIPGLHVQADIKGFTEKEKTANDAAADDAKKENLSTIHIQPKCTFKLAGVTFNLYDDIGIVTAKGLDNNGHSYDKDGKPTGFLRNRLQLDFIWAF